MLVQAPYPHPAEWKSAAATAAESATSYHPPPPPPLGSEQLMPPPTSTHTSVTSLPIRSRPGHSPRNGLKHAPSSSLSDESLPSARDLLPDRPPKRHNRSPQKTIAVVNASGRQAASLIRVASAVGYSVRAQLRNLEHVYAREVSDLPNVTILLGDLYATPKPSSSPSTAEVNHELIDRLFTGAQLAFINTTFYGNEVEIGRALADAAVAAGIEHYIYSSMPDHSAADPAWPALPMWSTKARVEEYIRRLGARLPATFVYTGIYNNNFTSLPYPLFCMALQDDGSFTWTAPFHPRVPLPWLDAEHDVGPAVLQLFKDGPRPHAHQGVALAYEMLTPVEACRVFARGVGRPVRYRYEPRIAVSVKIPQGYKDQLHALEALYAFGVDDPARQPPYFGSAALERQCPMEAMQLWEGYRGLEEYAREVFPLEEAANGLKWMEDDRVGAPEEQDGDHDVEADLADEAVDARVDDPSHHHGNKDADGDGHGDEDDDDDDDDDGLVMMSSSTAGPGHGRLSGGLATGIVADGPARKQESWLA